MQTLSLFADLATMPHNSFCGAKASFSNQVAFKTHLNAHVPPPPAATVPDLSKLWPDENWSARNEPSYLTQNDGNFEKTNDSLVDDLNLADLTYSLISQAVDDIVLRNRHAQESLDFLNEGNFIFQIWCSVVNQSPRDVREAIAAKNNGVLQAVGKLNILKLIDPLPLPPQTNLF